MRGSRGASSAFAGVTLVVALLAGTACTASEKDATVILDEWRLELDPATTDSGRVRVFIENDGEREHELVLLRAQSPDDLPLLEDGSVDETKASIADRIEPLEPGSYESAFHNVRKGTYVLVCNLVTDGEAHFQQGMHQVLDIRESDFDRSIFD